MAPMMRTHSRKANSSLSFSNRLRHTLQYKGENIRPDDTQQAVRMQRSEQKTRLSSAQTEQEKAAMPTSGDSSSPSIPTVPKATSDHFTREPHSRTPQNSTQSEATPSAKTRIASKLMTRVLNAILNKAPETPPVVVPPSLANNPAAERSDMVRPRTYSTVKRVLH